MPASHEASSSDKGLFTGKLSPLVDQCIWITFRHPLPSKSGNHSYCRRRVHDYYETLSFAEIYNERPIQNRITPDYARLCLHRECLYCERRTSSCPNR